MKLIISVAIATLMLLSLSGRAYSGVESTGVGMTPGGGGGGGGGSATPGGSDTQVQYNNAGAFDGSSAITFALGVPTITGGTHTAITSFGLRSTAAAFDLKIANAEVLTADRTLTWNLGNTSRTLTVAGNTTIPIASQAVTISGPTAARTWTADDANITIPSRVGANTWSATNTFTTGPIFSGVDIQVSWNATSGSAFRTMNNTSFPGDVYAKGITPNVPALATGTAANAWHVFEGADYNYNFGNCSAGGSAGTDPLFCVHSHNQSTTEYLELSHNATHGVIKVGAGGLTVPAHLGSAGTAPTVSACGTSPSTVTGNDSYGRLTTGSGGTVQSCTLTFAAAYVTAPSCVANDETTILAVRATATTTTLVIDSAVAGTLASQVVTYICRGL